MSKLKGIKLLTIAILAVLLLTPLMSAAALAVTVPSFTLSESSNMLQYQLPAGTSFNGTVSTTGMVRVWVSAPNGAQIVDLGIIDQTTTFSFVAQQNGTYLINFENDMPNTIQVSFSYVTDPQIPTGNNSAQTTYLLIIVVIAVVGSIMIIIIMRHNSKVEDAKAAKTNSRVAQS